jgi:ABC-type uncharacterized transport system ATPase subunit
MSTPLQVVRNLAMNFGGVVAVHNVSFDLQEGELLCIIGPNGAGKTTLINLLSGALRPVSGSIIFAGQEIIGLPLYRYARLGIVRKFQVPSYFQSMSPRDNLEVAQLGSGARGEKSNTDEILRLIGLAGVADDAIADALAHGQKQWLEIGMALMCQPKLIILDEPTAGMSREETDKTVEIVLGMKGQRAVIVIEHHMRFVRALNARTMVMHQGEVICEGIFSEIENDPRVRDIYLGRK